jgi:hypothetical protein
MDHSLLVSVQTIEIAVIGQVAATTRQASDSHRARACESNCRVFAAT